MKRRKVVTSAALTAICLVLVIPIVVYSFPFIVGADSSYTVMSGSMSPALSPGDLVIVKEDYPIDIGDMVTVESGEFIYTHRVVEKLEGNRFMLKGDANEDPDQGLIEASQIIGKVVLVFPFGYLYTSYGFTLALLVPATIIIGKQMHTIYQHTKRRNKRETMMWRRKSQRSAMMGTSTLLLALILTVSTTRIIAPQFIGGSSSYFSDVEWGTGLFRAGTWVFSSTITCSASDSPIILNEQIMIQGSINPAHSGVTVTLTYEFESTITTSTVQTNAIGEYSELFTRDIIGSWQITASWNGDDDHYGDTSETVTVTVVS